MNTEKNRNLLGTLAFAALIVALWNPGLAATAVRPLQGPIILVHAGAIDQYMWYASTYVSNLVDDRLLGDAGMRAIQATAIVGLAKIARSSHATSLSMSVLYKTSTASNLYGVPTAADQTKLCVITVPRSGAMKFGEAWARSVADGKTPVQVKVTTIGALPPSQ